MLLLLHTYNLVLILTRHVCMCMYAAASRERTAGLPSTNVQPKRRPSSSASLTRSAIHPDDVGRLRRPPARVRGLHASPGHAILPGARTEPTLQAGGRRQHRRQQALGAATLLSVGTLKKGPLGLP